MTAYRSTNTYRQDLLRYDGTVVVNVTVAPAVIAGTSTASAVTVIGGTGVTVTPATVAATSTVPAVAISFGTSVTVSVATIAATVTFPAVSIFQSQTVFVDAVAVAATTPAVTITEGAGVSTTVTVDTTSTVPSVTVTEGAGVTISLTTVSSSGLIPEPDITEGNGVTIIAAVPAFARIPAPNVITGNGVLVYRLTIRCFARVPDLGLKSQPILNADAPGALLDVLPYNTISIERRWKSRWAAPARRGRNIFILTDNTITERYPVDASTISRQILGGHEAPDNLSSEEFDLLVDAGYSFEVK